MFLKRSRMPWRMESEGSEAVSVYRPHKREEEPFEGVARQFLFLFCHENDTINLDYSRVEVAAASRRDGCSCGTLPQVHHNKADAVRSARPCGVNLADSFSW